MPHLTRAQVAKRWRARNPQRQAESKARVQARARALRQLGQAYPDTLRELYLDECRRADIAPAATPGAPKYPRGKVPTDDDLPPELHIEKLKASD